MRFFHSRQPQQELPAAPPDPAMLRVAHQARADAATQRWANWVEQRLLPAVNAALGAARDVSFELDPVIVSGRNGRASVYELESYSGWVPLVAAALQGEAYRGYRVRCFISWYATRDDSGSSKEVPPDQVAAEVKRVKEYYRLKAVTIWISPL